MNFRESSNWAKECPKSKKNGAGNAESGSKFQKAVASVGPQQEHVKGQSQARWTPAARGAIALGIPAVFSNGTPSADGRWFAAIAPQSHRIDCLD